MSRLLHPKLRKERMNNRYSGTVERTEKTRIILGKTCTEYHVSSWRLMDSKRTEQADYKVWATTDVSFNMEPFRLMMQVLRLFYNRDETYRNELDKIQGIQMRDEYVSKRFPWKKMYITEQGEFLKKVPPEGTFQVPAGYTRKDLIYWDDLR